MTLIVTDDKDKQSVEATGHPPECTEPAPGSVTNTPHNVSINTASGDEKPIATAASTLSVPSHAHDYDEENGCHEITSHSITSYNTTNLSSSLNIDGNAVLIVNDNVATDPGSGGPVNLVDSGINNSLSEQP